MTIDINEIIPMVSGTRGAPMGRMDIGKKPTGERVYDRYVPMCSCCGAYDKGGAYWGSPLRQEGWGRLRVSFTKDLTYVEFYRE